MGAMSFVNTGVSGPAAAAPGIAMRSVSAIALTPEVRAVADAGACALPPRAVANRTAFIALPQLEIQATSRRAVQSADCAPASASRQRTKAYGLRGVWPYQARKF